MADRTRIVTALRAMASRIEQGEEPVCYVRRIDYDEMALTADRARDLAEAELELDEECECHSDIECVEWGVMVTVESAVVVAAGRPPKGRGWDSVLQYGLRPDGIHVVPTALVSECHECGHEEAVMPHAPCSACGYVVPYALEVSRG